MRVSRRRIVTMIRPILFSILGLFALLPVSSHQRPALAPPLESLSGTVPPVYFGMHVHGLLEFTSWPTVPFGAIRFWDTGVTWRDLEPNKNDWHFGRLDRLVNLTADHHVEMVLCFGKTPAWAANVSGDAQQREHIDTAPPNLDDWRDLVEKVASRYKGKIQAYEVWNEPNWHGFYTGDVRTMVEMTRIAAQTIHAIDPAALVVSPSVTSFDGLDWFESFLEKGGAQFVDVIGYHLYVTPDAPEQIPALAAEVRSRMNRNHINLPLWNTETGWANPKHFTSADEASGYVARSILLAWAAGVSRFYWYAWDEHDWCTLLLTEGQDSRPTPAAKAFQIMQSWMTGARIDSCAEDDRHLWTCRLMRDGQTTWIVWNPSGKTHFQLPPNPGRNGEWSFTDLSGDTWKPKPGDADITPQPRLLRWTSR